MMPREAVRWNAPANVFGKWVEAMRSGRYGWTLEMLRVASTPTDSYSPVGVLLDSIDPKSWALHPFYAYWTWRGQTQRPPAEVRDQIRWSGSFQYRLRLLAMQCSDHAHLADRLGEIVDVDGGPVKITPPPPPKKRGRKK